MDVSFNKIGTELKNSRSNINELKNNDRTLTEWCRVTNARLVSISNTCDRIVKKCQVQNHELEDISFSHINDELTILKSHILEIVDNTNIFVTHLARSDSERQELKNELIAHVEQSHKNNETNQHIARHSTPLTEEKHCFKESLTPFPGENV
ncbi:hypothetical protein O181_112099 [Austropuccinia psidii MF-1]|uniref:Uncharacterized protein n=1 Tax=Austropuccinia psidii MF-1 TaxID=1389203 RepID=A0A9Q3K193_9BASI|nr:hypothetical protein [Austropuccinia psidii MF-1]